jgi:hypothetical protein
MARRINQSFLEAVDACPPFVAFVLGRRNGSRTRAAIIEFCVASGLSETTAARISRKLTWERVPAWQIDVFCRACGVNPLCMKRHREYLRETWQSKRPLAHLSDRQLREFNLLSARWLALRERRQREARA